MSIIPIAVSQRTSKHRELDETRDVLDLRMTSWLMEVGMAPYPVPNNFFRKKNLEDWLEHLQPQAILLSGGNDLGESKDRDQTEKILLEYAQVKDLPVLGICRGMQSLGVHFGSGLREVEGHVKVSHDVVIEGESVRVNSFHGFALDSVPEGFRVLATSSDGEIEAVTHRFKNWEGWMWHPERESPFNPFLIKRAKKIFGITQRQ